eukprot:EG_transcript_2662
MAATAPEEAEGWAEDPAGPSVFDSAEYVAHHLREVQAAHAWALRSLQRLVQQVAQSKRETRTVDPQVAVWLDETVAAMKEAEQERDTVVRALETPKDVQRVNGRWWTRQALADGVVACFLDLPQRDMRTLSISQACHRFHTKFGSTPKEVHNRFPGPKLQQFLATLPALEQNDGERRWEKEIFTRRLLEGVPALKYNGLYERTHILVGEDGVQRLQNANVFIAGVGGVGGWVAEALARAGVGALTVVDFDTVDHTNKNRQLLALDSTLGRNKAVVMAERIKDINPACCVTAVQEMITHDNVHDLLGAQRYSAVVDCIDLIVYKAELLATAYHMCLPTFTSCGAGGKLDPAALRVGDVLQTQGADVWSSFTRRLRDQLVARGVKEGGITAVYTTDISSNPLTPEHVAGENFRPRSTNGTVSFIPPLFGFALAGAVVNFLLTDGPLLFRLPQPTPLPPAGPPQNRRHGRHQHRSPAPSEPSAPEPDEPVDAASPDAGGEGPERLSRAAGADGTLPEDVERRLRALRALVGRTPLLRVTCQYQRRQFYIYCKWEGQQLTGSTKDRVALQMVEDAYRAGLIDRRTEIVEASSGSTGVALASVGAALGNPVTIVIPDSASRERMALLHGYGAKIIPVPVEKSKSRLQCCIDFAEAYTQQRPTQRWQPRQFASPANVKAHCDSTAPEILEALQRHGLQPSAFIAGVGTGGTVLGVGRGLRRVLGRSVQVHPLAIEGCPIRSTPVRQRIAGLVEGLVPEALQEELEGRAPERTLDEVVEVADGDAILMAQRIAGSLGLGVGLSSGANLVGAIKVFLRQPPGVPAAEADDGGRGALLGPLPGDPVVVTVFCDCNKKYLTTDLIGREAALPGYLTPDVRLLALDVL